MVQRQVGLRDSISYKPGGRICQTGKETANLLAVWRGRSEGGRRRRRRRRRRKASGVDDHSVFRRGAVPGVVRVVRVDDGRRRRRTHGGMRMGMNASDARGRAILADPLGGASDSEKCSVGSVLAAAVHRGENGFKFFWPKYLGSSFFCSKMGKSSFKDYICENLVSY